MAEIAPVQLYIKVIEARNIKGVEKNGNSDPIVELYVGDNKKDFLKTKVIDDTLAPQWHEEFIFTMTSNTIPITFHVKDWNRFSKNVSLGTAVIDPRDIAIGTATEMWLPLSVQGELHIFVQCTPLMFTPTKAKQVRLRSFRMVLERSVYYPNDTIRGAVIFNVGKPKKIRGVRVRFSGSSVVQWSESRGSGNSRRTVTYHSHFIFFNPVATLYGNERGSKKDFKIPSGGYYWAFEYQIPSIAPPSYKHNIGKNTYFVQGYVDIPMLIDKEVQQTITLTAEYGALTPMPITKFAKKGKSKLGSDQDIQFSISTPQIGYMGESFPVDVTITNNGNKEVKELVLKVKAKSYFTAHSVEGWKTRKVVDVLVNHKVKGVAGFPIAPGSTFVGSILIPLPPAIAASIPEAISPLIQVIHTIKGRFNTSGNVFTKASNAKSTPILIGERNMIAPPPPPAQQVVSNQIVIAQPPPDIYNYLAPPPFQSEYPDGYVQNLPSHEYIQGNTVQAPQWVEEVSGAQVYQPGTVIESTLSEEQY